MKYKITLKVLDLNPILPINYQYELSSWILNTLEGVEDDFALFLKRKKLETRRKNFRLFTFSNLYVPAREIFADRLQIFSSEISFILSFYLDHLAERFIQDLFMYRLFTLGDKLSRATFRVESVQSLPYKEIKETVTIKTLSPLLLSKANERGNVDFLAPFHPDYKDMFLHNLLLKYVKVVGETNQRLDNFTANEMVLQPNFNKRIRSRLVTIKAHTSKEAKIRGFLYEFDLVAPQDVIELGLLAGFGEKNELGFGACDLVV